jgi:hypothetical protein
MTARPTTLVESDQLAQAAVNVMRSEDFVPKGRRWPFPRVSKAHKDYDKAVQDITDRRRQTRENAVEQGILKERTSADGIFERAKSEAQATHDRKIADARKPFTETETEARTKRDAAIAAANRAYQETIEKADLIYRQEAVGVEEEFEAVMGVARSLHDQSYAALEIKRKGELAHVAKDLKTIPLEGPMRVVEDRQAWSPDDRRKALIAIIDMAGRDDFDHELVDICLQNVMGYVFQDRYLPLDAQQHRLMDANLLEALVELARRSPAKRPIVVKYMHNIVTQNPGHSSPTFIKHLTELYLATSVDTATIYVQDPIENEKTFELMRDSIADTLKLTPRRSQVPPPAGTVQTPLPEVADADDRDTPLIVKAPNAEITADVDLHDFIAMENDEAATAETPPEASSPAHESESRTGTETDNSTAMPELPSKRTVNRKKTPSPEGAT